ncbi:MAG TPA: hypothetical protein VF395_15465 [Polyangiaceae bacterium]
MSLLDVSNLGRVCTSMKDWERLSEALARIDAAAGAAKENAE